MNLPSKTYLKSKENMKKFYNLIEKEIKNNLPDYDKIEDKEKFLIVFNYIYKSARDNFNIIFENTKEFSEKSEKEKRDLKDFILGLNFLISSGILFIEEYLDLKEEIKTLFEKADNDINSIDQPEKLSDILKMSEEAKIGVELIIEQDLAKGTAKIYDSIIFVSQVIE